MNQKKISKFEREVKSNGNTLPHTGIFFPLSLVFLMSIWKNSLVLFGMPHYYLQTNGSKKNSRARNAQEVPNVRSYVSADVPALAMMRTWDGGKHKNKEMQQMSESLARVKVQRVLKFSVFECVNPASGGWSRAAPGPPGVVFWTSGVTRTLKNNQKMPPITRKEK